MPFKMAPVRKSAQHFLETQQCNKQQPDKRIYRSVCLRVRLRLKRCRTLHFHRANNPIREL